MPVPRRFDRRPPERDTTRINERIRVPEVRVIDEEGNQVGVMKTPDALALVHRLLTDSTGPVYEDCGEDLREATDAAREALEEAHY